VWNPDKRTAFQPDLAKDNHALQHVIHGSKLRSFYEVFFGEAVLHFDFTWIRAVGPGHGTHPHCDLVYMGRGTHDLLTCWIPYGDVPLDLGGLIVLEDSHRKSDRIRTYLEVDVDTYCSNRPDQVKKALEEERWSHPGRLSTNPETLRQKLGGRWLTADWKAGDFITFKMNTVHASLDNQTDRIRLSSDTRYQRASEPADERWIGANPPGHSRAGKRGRIC
jgi:ectoine hydroxylase-related dioxygenase (phytanoyl-CoA dioxygenase family)